MQAAIPARTRKWARDTTRKNNLRRDSCLPIARNVLRTKTAAHQHPNSTNCKQQLFQFALSVDTRATPAVDLN
jgi:hypothetical protein